MPAPLLVLAAKGIAKAIAVQGGRGVVTRQLRKKILDAAKKADAQLKKEAAERAKNCPSCKAKKNPCRSLRSGNPKGAGPFRGGSHAGTKKPGFESNHMPPKSVSPLSEARGPAIRMDKADHRKLTSTGSSLDSMEFRERQKELINDNKFNEAFGMEAADVIDKFGAKYDDAIAESAAYLACLEANGLIP
jgi:hypothetical protein